jgi:zinc protease
MKNVLLPFLFVVFLALAAKSNAANQFFPFPYELYKLDNGFKAYLSPVKGSGLVAYFSVVRTGSRDEWEPGKSGFAHFFEHMMFRGTKTYPGPVYDRIITEMGADANAFTTDDLTCYHLSFPTEHLEKVMELESDRFENLSYGESEFKTEAGAVYGEYLKGRTDPFEVLFENLQNTAFDAHTYKHTTMGFEADIKNMPAMYDYSLSFFQRYYRPENVVLLLAGDFDAGKAKTLIQKYYGDWNAGYVPPQITPEPEQTGERSKDVSYAGKTLPVYWVSYKGDAFNPESKMIAAADLLENLAFGESSEIYKKLVLREQKVQYIATWFPHNRDPFLYSVYAMIKDEKDIPYVKEEIDRTVEKFKNELVAADKLENIKKRARYGFLMNLETPEQLAGALARNVALTGEIDSVNKFYATLDSIAPQDILAAARKYFQKDRRTAVVLKGEKE